MAKESLYAPIKAPVFRETFVDEQTTRALGGVPTSVTYSGGVGTFNGSSSYILYSSKAFGLTPVFTVRIRLTSYTLASGSVTNFCDFRNSDGTGSGYIVDNTGGSLGVNSGTSYINGVASSTLTTSTKEIVVTGITLGGITALTRQIYIGSRYSVSNFMNGSMELFEIYEGTLTAQEVANLYNNKRYNALAQGQTFINENYFVGNGASNTYATTPDSVASSPTGDIELIAKINIDAISNQGSIISKANVAGTDFGYNFFINAGTLSFAHNPTGDTGTRITSTCTANLSTVYTAGNDIWVKMTRSASTGDIKFYYSYDGSTYTQLGTTVSTTPSGLYDSVLSTYIGNWANTLYFFSGRIYYVSLSSTIGGSPTVVFNPNSYNTTTYASTWTSTTGEVWTMTQTGGGYIQYSKKEIINVDAKNGCICDKWGNTITNTSTSIIRDGSVFAMDFSTSNSKIDCGTPSTLLGNKTMIMWVKPYYVTSATGSFNAFSNGQFILQADFGGGEAWYFSRANFTGSYIYSPNSIKENVWQMIVVTSTSTGYSIMYKNGASIISGAMQAPVSGGALTIGNGSSAGKPRINGLRIIDGILTPVEVSQLFSSERKNYNV